MKYLFLLLTCCCAMQAEDAFEDILTLIQNKQNISKISQFFSKHRKEFGHNLEKILVALAHYAKDLKIDPLDLEDPANTLIKKIVDDGAEPWSRTYTISEIPYEIYPEIDLDGATSLHRLVADKNTRMDQLIKKIDAEYPMIDIPLSKQSTLLIQNLQTRLNAQTKFTLQTPLMLAINLGKTNMAKALIIRGANVAVKDKNGDTIFHYLMKRNNISLFKELFEKYSPYILAAIKPHRDEYYKLVEYAIEHRLIPFFDVLVNNPLTQANIITVHRTEDLFKPLSDSEINVLHSFPLTNFFRKDAWHTHPDDMIYYAQQLLAHGAKVQGVFSLPNEIYKTAIAVYDELSPERQEKFKTQIITELLTVEQPPEKIILQNPDIFNDLMVKTRVDSTEHKSPSDGGTKNVASKLSKLKNNLTILSKRLQT